MIDGTKRFKNEASDWVKRRSKVMAGINWARNVQIKIMEAKEAHIQILIKAS